MAAYTDLTVAERNEIAGLFANWLKNYTDEVVFKVMEQREEILNNAFAMKLLRELKEREDKEAEEFVNDINWLFRDIDSRKKYGTRNNVLTHSKSYRDVLYDMYIR